MKTTSSTPNNTLNASNKLKQQVKQHKPKSHHQQQPPHRTRGRVNNINDEHDEIDDYDMVDDDDLEIEDDHRDDNDTIYDRENEIKEIDARLKSLQMFMKNNMP